MDAVDADARVTDAHVPDARLGDARALDARVDAAVDSTVPADRGGVPDAAPDLGTGDAFVPISTAPCEPRGGMVGVPFADGTCYLMDPRPVSQGEYHAAVQTAPLVSNHPACADASPGTGPRTNAPGYARRYEGCHFAPASHEEPTDSDNRLPWPPAPTDFDKPMVCVTWCDADAYCMARGKRLCGVRGEFDAQRYNGALVEDHRASEFVNACTAAGRFHFPMGHQHILLTPEQRFCGLGSGHLWILDERCPDWQGAFDGLWGLGRVAEYIGPWALAVVAIDPGYRGEPDPEPRRGCRVISTEQFVGYERLLTDQPDLHFDGARTFRCCADYDTFE